MIEKFIARVPARIWEEGRPPRMRVWENEFNVAAWVRFASGSGNAALVVFHIDDAGEHVTEVDRTRVEGDGTALMSGLVRLRFTGEVQQVQVDIQLEDGAQRFLVEELFIQRRGSALRREDKLISNF